MFLFSGNRKYMMILQRKPKRTRREGSALYVSRRTTPPRKGLEALIRGRQPNLIGVTRVMNDIRNYMRIFDLRGSDKATIDGRKLLRKVYSTKAAEDYLKWGFIPVQGTKKDGKVLASYGCHQQSMVLHKALKAMGIKAHLVRYISHNAPHTTVIFKMNGKMYEADPFYGRIGDVSEKAQKSGKIIQNKPISWERYVAQMEIGTIF